MTSDRCPHARSRGRGFEEESSPRYRCHCSTVSTAPTAARAVAKSPPGAGLETIGGCTGLVVVGRLAGGAGLAGSVLATEHLGPVEHLRQLRQRSADGYR